MSEITLLGALVAIWSKHTCHTVRCYRWSRHDVPGTPYKTCRRHAPHLPDTAPTASDIKDAYEASRNDTEGTR